MPKILLIALAILLLVECDKDNSGPDDLSGCNVVPSVDDLLITTTVQALAADSMFGRWTPHNGVEKAQKYIEAKLQEMDVDPLETTYAVPFTMTSSLPTEISVKLNGVDVPKANLALNPIAKTGTIKPFSEVIFVRPEHGEDLNHVINELIYDLFYEYRTGKDYVIIVPTSLTSDFRNYQKYLADRRVYSERGSYLKWYTYFGQANILTILSDERSFMSIEGSFEYSTPTTLNNIAAVLPGKSKSDEIVIFSAHFDHIGVIKSVLGDSIANGANDNASGVAGVLALLDFYKKRGDHQRTLWFLFFNAEELGKVGSTAFVGQYKGSNIKTVINLDMVGNEVNGTPGAAYLTGFQESDLGITMQRNIDCINRTIIDDVVMAESNYTRSDNLPFNEAGIVAHTVTTFDNTNYSAYHRVDDNVNNVDIEKIVDVVISIIKGSTSIVNGSR